MNNLVAIKDKLQYLKILNVKDSEKKKFFDLGGCGLEIEFAVNYEQRCNAYIKTGLKKLKEFVGDRGIFTTDPSIGSFLDVEIVLNPFPKEELQGIFQGIVDIIDFYENFEFNDNCGVHANFRADENLKRAFYQVLTDGRYDSERFCHSKYKVDFMKTVTNPDGSIKPYEEYLAFQKTVGAKYTGVNFLKENLAEIRTLNLAWEDVSFFCDAYDEACRLL